jgi:hypothetical protein
MIYFGPSIINWNPSLFLGKVFMYRGIKMIQGRNYHS